MSLRDDVQGDVRSFINDHQDDFADALAEELEFDRNDMDFLDESFHCDIIDRSYSLQDAAAILAEVENEETDAGLWEGQQPEEAVCTKAAFSYGLDVWFAVERRYNDLLEQVNDRVGKIEEEHEDAEADRKAIAEEVVAEYLRKDAFEPLVTTADKIQAIRRWVYLGNQAGMWGEYPCGSSYIDARCGSGHGMPDVKDFVDYDHECAALVPEIRGKYRRDVETYLENLLAAARLIESADE